jgi:outer membrane protein TolC
MQKFLLSCLLTTLLFNQSFAQEGLDFYLSEAQSNSPLLKDYKNQVLSNQLDSLRLLASFKPQITAATNNNYYPALGSFGYDNAISNGGNYTAQLFVNKPLISRRNLANQLETIFLQSSGIQANTKISQQDLSRTITTQYVTTYGDYLQIKFNQEVLELFKNEEVILKKLTQTNVYKQTEYLTFLVTLQQQELQLKRLKIQFLNDFGTLNYLCGIAPENNQQTQITEIPTPDIAFPQLPEVRTSVFYRPYVFDSLKIRNSDRQIDFAYKIRGNVFADGGFVSSLSMQPYYNFGASFGFNATILLYDGRQKNLQHSRNKIAELNRQNYRNFFLKQYTQQTSQLFQQLKLYEDLSIEMLDKSKYSQRLIEANSRLITTGDVRIVDYLLATTNFLNAKNQITLNEINRLQIKNQLNYWNK